MHQAVTISTTATNSFPSTQKLLPPILLTNQTPNTDVLDWFQNHQFEDLEDWHLPTSNESISTHPPTIQSISSPTAQKFTFSRMHSRTTHPESNASTDRSTAATNNNRWRFNGTGQLIDSEAASASWVADELGRLKIGDVAVDPSEDPHATIPTPPKVATTGTVVHLNEASPLETSSDVSGDSSPHTSDHQIPISHSRGSSTDTTVSSSHDSAILGPSQTLLAPAHSPLKVGAVGEVKERPHSFSGGLSSADLKRLQLAGDGPVNHFQNGDIADRHMQQQQPLSALQYRETLGFNDKQFPPEQLTYPSLATHSLNASRPQPQQYEYRPSPTSTTMPPLPHRDDVQVEYNHQQQQQRSLNHLSHGSGNEAATVPSAFVLGRPNAVDAPPFRQPLRGFGQQGVLSSPTALGYTGGHHTSHLSLGNTQQLYDMMLHGQAQESHHPAVTRVQQQHNVFRATHHHSASDPSNIRDAATLAMLSNNMQAFAPPGPTMYSPAMAPPPLPPMSLYANQFYGAQDQYSHPDVATAQAMAARLQAQYTGPYGSVPAQGMGMESGMSSPVSGQNGPSANNRKLGLYKTELCRSWEEKGTCRYGSKCQFAHGEDELRKVTRHPKYKTEICRTFWVSGSCPYGKRCCFIHTELPTAGTTPGGTENAPPPPNTDGRARSLSTNSDPNDASVSLLARISAKRSHDVPGGNNGSTPVDVNPPSNNFQFSTRPPTGSLRVDTSALDNPVVKQNKSAYPSFASNGILLPAGEQVSVKSPIPVTAGPDLGRHNNSRLEIVGYNQQHLTKATPTTPNVRHSFNGTEVELNFNGSPPSVSGHPSSFGMQSVESGSSMNNYHASRPSGHIRSGSAGNWGSFPRNSHLAPSPFPQSSSPAGEANVHAPWSTSELAVGSSRLHETWV